ncbi:MAG: hypothetical protein FWE16_00065 [Firmicutes bacterium]|nr:hypothetical protein [Bacillota bacterium]
MNKKQIGIIIGASVAGLAVVTLMILWVTGVFGNTIRNGTYTFHNMTFGNLTINSNANMQIDQLSLPPVEDVFIAIGLSHVSIDVSGNQLSLRPMSATAQIETFRHRLGPNNVVEIYVTQQMLTGPEIDFEDDRLLTFGQTGWQTLTFGNSVMRFVNRQIVLEVPFIVVNAPTLFIRFSR